MTEWVAAVFLVAISLVMIWLIVRWQVSTSIERRLISYQLTENAERSPLRSVNQSVRRLWWLSPICGLLFFNLLYFTTNWPWIYQLALAVIISLLVWQADGMYYQWVLRRCEQQLADMIDMLVASLKAGATLQSSLNSVSDELKQPLRGLVEEVNQRIRFGDDVTRVLSDFSDRLPLETMRLFSISLSVNWQFGGKLAQTLANVGRTVRDRIEISRRLEAMTIQSRLSVISILLTTYFIAALMWRNDPERMSGFLSSTIGQYLVAAAMLLQGVGIVWISRLSQPRF